MNTVKCLAISGEERAYHEVKTSHEKYQVNQQEPMLPQCYLSFSNEGSSDITSLVSNENTLLVRICFWKAETEYDDENRWACTEPEQRSPSMTSSIY